MKFGEALLAIEAGKCIARSEWNGKGMFVYYVPAASYPVQTGAAINYFGAGTMVPYEAYMAIKKMNGKVRIWTPSFNDCFANDWIIFEKPVITALSGVEFASQCLTSAIKTD